jgi:beta-glucanase (GH16 family)
MANIAFGSKYFIFSKFSTIPKTSKIEQDRADLAKEYSDYKEYKKSAELKEFEELNAYIESQDHKERLLRVRKNKAAEEDKIKTYGDQKKSKKFKAFYKFGESQKLKDYNTIAASDDLKKYNELKALTTSADFSSRKHKLEQAIKEAGSKDKKDQGGQKKAELEKQLNELLQQEKQFKQLSKSRNIKFYFKFGNSQKFKDFTAFEKSEELADHLALEKYLASDEHKEKLNALNASEAEENNKIKKHQEYKSSKKYKWYQEVKGSGKFDEMKKWKVLFEDDFSKGSLDAQKWMTRYYWGDKLMNDAYAHEFDRAFPTDGKNIEVSKTLKIITRKEKTEGKKWKIPFGFVPQEFEFTTGLVSTAKTFRMKYGKVEAKIKVNFAKPVNYNFWMASENNLPHVDIMKLRKKKSKVDVGLAYGKITDEKGPTKKTAEFTGLDVSQDFFIYTLEWTKDKLTWKINDIVVNDQTQGVPHEEMYLVFSSSITENTNGSRLPASMEVDWVRCYQEA